jgi:hypothetical protein
VSGDRCLAQDNNESAYKGIISGTMTLALQLSCGELALYYKGTAAVIASTASVVLSLQDLMSRVAIVPTVLHE